MTENSENAPRGEPTAPAAPAVSEPRAEPDAPRSAFIFVFAVCGVGVLGLMLLGVDQLFNLSLREEIAQKVLRPENSMLRQLRADEQAKLTRYQWVDQKAGQLRIPLERAKELTLSEWKTRPSGFAAGAPNLPATPAAGAAGSKPRAGESAPGGAASKGAPGPAGGAGASPAPGSPP